MKNFKLLAVIVTLLIAVNCVLIGVLWYNNYSRHQQHPPPMQGQAFEYLTRELKLNAVQIKQYQALRDQHMAFTRKVGEEMRLQRDSFFDNLKSKAANIAAVNQLEKRILANQGRLDTATFYHFVRLKGILNDQQKAKFDSIIGDALHMMAQPHPQGGRPGPGGPPPANAPQQSTVSAPDGKPADQRPQGREQRHPPGRPGPDGRPPYGPPPGYPPPPGGPPPGGPPPGGEPPPQGGPPPLTR